uniref:NADH dehydrogenase [ubiquinone] 1 alpha subcomplex subunit 3 n=1 Tax=Monodon monoceros TaxID=40151 RepID=A0A8C6B4A4_MONMO
MAVKLTAFIKNAWAGWNYPILHHLGFTIILPTLGPYTMYNVLVNQATPYSRLRDDGNVPSYPQDTKAQLGVEGGSVSTPSSVAPYKNVKTE